jgi:formate dehydrogenase major subunit
MEIDASSPEVLDMRKTALDLLLSEHKGDCEAPCTMACPAHARVEEYVREGKKGEHLEGLKIIKERIPLPMSIGRVCPRFCEKDCRRNVTDKPVAINDFKRLAADMYYEDYMEERKPLNGKKVAIVGAGPAGYSAAYYLRLEGVASDIYEKREKPGGLLRYGIPEYRLPKGILDVELGHLPRMGGINIFTGKEVGKDISLNELKKKYDAVVLAFGSWGGSKMGIEGEEEAFEGLGWLEDIASNDFKASNPGKVIVVGGGNTAMDCVRTSVRLGSPEVICMYRRTEAEMPAEKIEIHEAKEEGVNFHFLTAPVKMTVKNGKKVLTCIKMELGEPDASGRRKPVPVKGSEYEIEADTVITAVGQKTVVIDGATVTKYGDVAVKESNNHMADNVFAAGDCVSGAATVVEAVAQGWRACYGILAYLDGKEFADDYKINVSRGHWQYLHKEDLVFIKPPVEHQRQPLGFISLEKRKTTFDEVCATFTKDQVEKEGERCFECSCTAKHDCRLKKYSELYKAHPEKIGGEKTMYDYDARHPEIILDPGKCIKCEQCVKICREVINQSLLGFKYRGYMTKISTGFDEVLPVNCKDCGECVKVCPVGALDWRIKK